MMVDPLPILAALGISQPGRVTPIAGGWDTSLWRVEDSGRHAYALRVFRPEQAPTCRREALVMRALAREARDRPRDAEAFGVELAVRAEECFGAGWLERSAVDVFARGQLRSALDGSFSGAEGPLSGVLSSAARLSGDDLPLQVGTSELRALVPVRDLIAT